MTAKKECSTRKREIFKTGGGLPPADKGVVGDDITSWLPNEFAVEFNDYDCDNALQEEVIIYFKAKI